MHVLYVFQLDCLRSTLPPTTITKTTIFFSSTPREVPYLLVYGSEIKHYTFGQ